MKQFRILLIMGGAFILLSANVMAQDTEEAGQAITYTIPAMAILDIEGVAPALSFVTPEEAGTPVAAVTDNASWLNYTSVVATETTNKVSVILSQAMPVSTTLTVTAGADAGGGDGTVGTATAVVTLSTTDQDIITGIGSCYTGDGNTNGHNLTYEWSVDAAGYADLVSNAEASDVTVTYTIVASL